MHSRTGCRRNSGRREPVDSATEMKTADGFYITGDGASSNDSYIKRAVNGTSSIKGVVSQIIDKGMPEDIDTVSRATCSSNAILEGCKKVLEAAERPTDMEAE